jgi:putative FmdB family regulatory protein
MPIYEYECKNCGERFDKMQPVTAEPLTECLVCGKGPVRRILHPVGVIFKGSGWYINDSRKSAPPSESSSGDSKSEKGGSSSESKSESSGQSEKSASASPSAKPEKAAGTD